LKIEATWRCRDVIGRSSPLLVLCKKPYFPSICRRIHELSKKQIKHPSILPSARQALYNPISQSHFVHPHPIPSVPQPCQPRWTKQCNPAYVRTLSAFSPPYAHNAKPTALPRYKMHNITSNNQWATNHAQNLFFGTPTPLQPIPPYAETNHFQLPQASPAP
jgi:hypothetical protein